MRFPMIASLLTMSALAFSGSALAQTCPGKLIALKNIVANDGAKIGEVQVYYNAATGMNCARTMHAGRTWGETRFTSIAMRTCKREDFDPNDVGNYCPSNSPSRVQAGQYDYRAGPVSLNGKGRCVHVVGVVGPKAALIIGHCD